MTDEQKTKSATGWCVLQMSDGGTEFIAFYESEGDAKKSAEELAKKHDGYSFMVMQKVGTAELQHRVEWRGIG